MITCCKIRGPDDNDKTPQGGIPKICDSGTYRLLKEKKVPSSTSSATDDLEGVSRHVCHYDAGMRLYVACGASEGDPSLNRRPGFIC